MRTFKIAGVEFMIENTVRGPHRGPRIAGEGFVAQGLVTTIDELRAQLQAVLSSLPEN